MSTLNHRERRKLELLFGMSSGYVLDFKDRTFGEFFDDVVQIDIHSERYQFKGTSKANKLRSFWEVEPDAIVGVVLGGLISEYEDSGGSQDQKLVAECRAIAGRLRASAPDLRSISEVAEFRVAPECAWRSSGQRSLYHPLTCS